MASSGPRRSSAASPPCVIRVREGRNSVRGVRDVQEGERSRLVPPTSPRNSLKKRAGALASKFPRASPPGTSSPRPKSSPMCTPRSMGTPRSMDKRSKLESEPDSPTTYRKVDRALESTEELLARFRQLNILPNELELSEIASTAGRSRLSSLEAAEFSSPNSEGHDLKHEDPELAGLLQNISEVNRLIQDLAVFGEQFQDKHQDFDSLAQCEIDRIEGSACSPDVARTLAQWPLIKELAILGQKIRDSEIETDTSTTLSISRDLLALKDRLQSMSYGNSSPGDKEPPELKTVSSQIAAHARKLSEGSQTLSFFSPKSCVIETRSLGSAEIPPGSAERGQSPYRELDPKALTEIVPQIPVTGWPSVNTTYGLASEAVLSSLQSRCVGAEESCSMRAAFNGTSRIGSPLIVPASASLSRPGRHSLPSQRELVASFQSPRAATISAPVQPTEIVTSFPIQRGATISAPYPARNSETSASYDRPERLLSTAPDIGRLSSAADCLNATLGGSVRGVHTPSLTAEATFFGTPRGTMSPPLPAEVQLSSPRVHRHSLGSPRSTAGSTVAPLLHASCVPAALQVAQAGEPLGWCRARSPSPAASCVTPRLPIQRVRSISPASKPGPGPSPGGVYRTVASAQRDHSREASPSPLWAPRPGSKGHALAPTPLIQAQPGSPDSKGKESASTIITAISAMTSLSGPGSIQAITGRVSLGGPASVQAPVRMTSLGGPASLRAPAGNAILGGPASVQAHPGLASLGGPASIQAPTGMANPGGPASMASPAVVRRVSAPAPSSLQCRKESPSLLGTFKELPLQTSVKQPDAEPPSPTKYVWEAVHTTTYRLKAVT